MADSSTPPTDPSRSSPARSPDAARSTSTQDSRPGGKDFIRSLVDQHLAEGRYDEVVTRFPPEPNGYLHIGHAKSIVLNFGLAEEYGGRCNLRFDDTNPITEEEVYAESMKEDVRWLGYEWDELRHAADYFETFWEHALTLIEAGKAYVDSQSEEEIRGNRGSVTEPGTDSPYRDRPVEENLDLFRRMRAGEFPDGAHVLRAKIDMAHDNMIMRDPVLYRIRHVDHYRARGEWNIYPLYDYAHCIEDAIEGITHSLCTLEFDNNREIYDWILDALGYEEPRPHQYEFARLNVEYTILSKRKLIRLVKEGHVAGWDDPRMPTIVGLRRRGIPPEAIRAFCEMIGVTKTETRVDVGKLEFAVRDHLNQSAPRVMAVLEPLRVVVTNYPEGKEERLEAPYYPRDIDREGSREVPFGRELYIEREDFAQDPPSGWRRLAPGWEVRLRHAYTLRCDEVVTDPETGEPTELRCTYDPDTLGSNPDRPVKGVIHWVSAAHAVPAEVRLYDRLFLAADAEDVPEGTDLTDLLNPDSLRVLPNARVEPSVTSDDPATRYQFERTGYFWRDPGSREGEGAAGTEGGSGRGPGLVFNRIVSLRDTWARRQEADRVSPGTEGVSGAGTATGASLSEERVEGARSAPGAPSGGTGATKGESGAGAEERTAAPAGPESRISDERRDARHDDPELAARFDRYQKELGLSLDDADVLTGSRAVSDFFEGALGTHDRPRSVAAWVVNEVMRELKDRDSADLPFTGSDLGRLVAMVDDGRLSRVMAKDVFRAMVEKGVDPEAMVKEQGLEKVSDTGVLEPLVDHLLQAYPDKVAEYRDGKTGLLGFFVGQVMKETGGTADPKLVKDLLAGKLNSEPTAP